MNSAEITSVIAFCLLTSFSYLSVIIDKHWRRNQMVGEQAQRFVDLLSSSRLATLYCCSLSVFLLNSFQPSYLWFLNSMFLLFCTAFVLKQMLYSSKFLLGSQCQKLSYRFKSNSLLWEVLKFSNHLGPWSWRLFIAMRNKSDFKAWIGFRKLSKWHIYNVNMSKFETVLVKMNHMLLAEG